ncbi:hypothetical protein GALL_273150 [mine drainage metagenome]|uniref:Uncharacterized protein n=1 Tax=mine drainage metagenome TaxID=410659 RepID=A0A1J5R498_9ZZZZ
MPDRANHENRMNTNLAAPPTELPRPANDGAAAVVAGQCFRLMAARHSRA